MQNGLGQLKGMKHVCYNEGVVNYRKLCPLC